MEVEDNLPILQWQMADLIASWMGYVTSPIEKDVLLFVYARTYSFRKTSDWINEAQFLEGVPGVIAPLSMTRSTLYKAIAGLQSKEILRKTIVRGKAFYAINHDWDLLKYIPKELVLGPSPRTTESVATDTTVRELTIRELYRVRPRTRELGGNVMSAMDNVRGAVAAATEKQKAARTKRKQKCNTSAVYKIWEDAFRETYPTERMFAWKAHEQHALFRALQRGVPQAELEAFVTFAVSNYANVITTHFSWMKGLSRLPSPAFVTTKIEIFYQAFKDESDPNRKLRQRLSSVEQPLTAPAPEPLDANELERLRRENEALKSKLGTKVVETATKRKLRIRGYIKHGKDTAQTTTGKTGDTTGSPFRKWD